MSIFTSNSPHPYGVLPTGNGLLLRDPNLVRRRGLGLLGVISDEAVLEILSFLDGRELSTILKVSRVFYVYGNYSDLWRDLTLRKFDGSVDFISTWKDTFSKMTYAKVTGSSSNVAEAFLPHKPIKVANVFCNVLYRSWTCHTCDLRYACPGFYDKCGVVRMDATELTTESFVENFEMKNRPVIISNATTHWPSMKNWNSKYLIDKCKNKKFRATSATAPEAASFTMEEYFKYSTQTMEEAALYLFDRNFTTLGGLGDDYDVPSYFNSATSLHGTDLFRVFGEKQRPDYRWLIAVPLSTGEWLLSFWPAHLEAKKNLDPKSRPFECIVEQGEMIFVPHGFWHMVVNLDDCIAITQNYVSTSNLSDCLRFLREKPDQISGVRDRIGEAVQPEEIYKIFVEKLETVLPRTILDKAVLESFSKKKSVMKRKQNELSGVFNGTHNSSNIAKDQGQRKSKVQDIKNSDINNAPSPQFSFGFSFI